MPSVQFPVVLALAVGAYFLCRKCGMKVSHVLICAGLGFYLADTSFAPTLHTTVDAVSGLFGRLG